MRLRVRTVQDSEQFKIEIQSALHDDCLTDALQIARDDKQSQKSGNWGNGSLDLGYILNSR